MMVNPVSGSGVEAARVPTSTAVGRALNEPVKSHLTGARSAVGSAAADLARLGPPVDLNRVGEIRAAIARGVYTVDADRLAAAMLALDLPVRSA